MQYTKKPFVIDAMQVSAILVASPLPDWVILSITEEKMTVGGGTVHVDGQLAGSTDWVARYKPLVSSMDSPVRLVPDDLFNSMYQAI